MSESLMGLFLPVLSAKLLMLSSYNAVLATPSFYGYHMGFCLHLQQVQTTTYASPLTWTRKGRHLQLKSAIQEETAHMNINEWVTNLTVFIVGGF